MFFELTDFGTLFTDTEVTFRAGLSVSGKHSGHVRRYLAGYAQEADGTQAACQSQTKRIV